MLEWLFGINIHAKQSGGFEEGETIEEKMSHDYTYPSPTQDNFQEAIYSKRDFQLHTIGEKPEITAENKLDLYRESCKPDIKLTETQRLLSNFINPNTPYKGILIYHGTGVGKSCASIAIAEKFKPLVEKYGNKIHVLVPGPLNKQGYLGEIQKCTGETYTKFFQDKSVVLDEARKAKIRKNAINIINQHYRIMSHRSFYKKVIGEKIHEKIVSGSKIKKSSRKTETGEYEREISIDRIYNLDNTLLIVDEAHNVTGNGAGEAIKKIIANSKNLKIILLTATPNKNLADDCLELLNFLRPIDSPIERDKVFTSQHGHMMQFKPGGREYLRKMCRGYVSYLRGSDPLTFAERIDMGVIPPGLQFTKVTRCKMLDFQLGAYNRAVETSKNGLETSSEAASNIVLPGFTKDKKSITGYYGIEGYNEVKNQLRSAGDKLTKTIITQLIPDYDIANNSNLMYLTENKVITGEIFSLKYLKLFSVKFAIALQKINETVYGKRGAGLLFVYSNLVQVGIQPFQEVLNRNGYLEYQENISSYNIQDDTRCYYCEYTYGKHRHLPPDIPNHIFYPATYLTVTGKSDDNLDQIPEEKHKIIKNVFGNPNNKEGQTIKILLGSKVMNEGITLSNIKEIHILDVHYTLSSVDQVIGRGIRFCRHYDIISEENLFPKVEIYKYVVSLEHGLSIEEDRYKKAESKYKLIKETERILQEEAIDCPLNMNGNIFKDELKKYADCGTANNPCPAICGYMTCQYKCGDKLLNAKYYDPNRGIYKKINKSEIDYSTYDISLASEEIDYAKDKIKEMYKLGAIYELDDILKFVKKSYDKNKIDLFDDYYVYQALYELIPVTDNDFNNYKDVLVNKFGISGYLIYVDRYYIFQPFDENENLPIHYRQTYRPQIINKITLKDYMSNTKEWSKVVSTDSKSHKSSNPIFEYDIEYYETKPEYIYVGTIDYEYKRKDGNYDDNSSLADEFKIRISRPKVSSRKRETGIPSFKGAVCRNAKDKEELLSIAKKIGINTTNRGILRTDICKLINDRLYDLEKYSTITDSNKFTYLIVPSNHPTIPHPLNLEDRIKSLIDIIEKIYRTRLDYTLDSTIVKGDYSDITYRKYTLTINEQIDISEALTGYDYKRDKNKWIVTIN